MRERWALQDDWNLSEWPRGAPCPRPPPPHCSLASQQKRGGLWGLNSLHCSAETQLSCEWLSHWLNKEIPLWSWEILAVALELDPGCLPPEIRTCSQVKLSGWQRGEMCFEFPEQNYDGCSQGRGGSWQDGPLCDEGNVNELRSEVPASVEHQSLGITWFLFREPLLRPRNSNFLIGAFLGLLQEVI